MHIRVPAPPSFVTAAAWLVSLALVVFAIACGGSKTATPPPPAPLTITTVTSAGTTATAATVTWTTTVPSTSQVDYGTTASYGSSTPVDSNMVTSHSVAINGLTAGTQYDYRVRSKDANGVEAVSGNLTFNTSAVGGPVISNVSAAPTVSGATITWTTDKPTDQQVEYGTTTSYGQVSPLGTTLSTAHSVTLSSLAANTVYDYRVKSRDGSSNLTVSGNFTFQTTAAPPPVITAIASTPTATTATITWTTDVPATDQVVYGTTTAYGQTSALGSTLVTAHSVTLTGLTSGTLYDFAVKSANSVGTLATSGNATFTTLTVSTPPVISFISSVANSTGATIQWNTDQPATSQVEYGLTSAYGQSTTLNSSLVTTHSVVLSGLTSSTVYNFRVKSQNSSSNQAVSGNFTFTTTAPGTPVTIVPGWNVLPNTQLQNVCPANTPQYPFATNCSQVIRAWSGGMVDAGRNRLIVWGGGHNDYYGNEIYALTLNDQKLIRLNNPGPVADPAANQTALSDGTPNSRHTYNGLAYIAHADRMFVFGGDPAATFGFASNDTWTLNLATLQWQSMDPVNGGPPAHAFGVVADYDPNTKNVFLHDGSTFWQYTYETNTYVNLDTSSITIYNNAVIDPKRKMFFIIGSGFHAINIAPGSNYSLQDWTTLTTGCGVLQSTDYPGLAYDPVQDRIVGWAGGDTMFVFNPDTKICTTTSPANGPGAAQPNGTHGRFRYLPGLNVFAVVNDAGENAYVFKF